MSDPDDPQPADGESDEPQQLVLMRRLVELSLQRSSLSAQRTEMSAERSYMNAERTLSVWIRTALAVMVLGIAVDRLGLSTESHPRTIGPDTASTWVGAALVAFGVGIALIAGARFWRYATAYRARHTRPEHHGPYMAPAFAVLASVFGIVLLVLVLVTP